MAVSQILRVSKKRLGATYVVANPSLPTREVMSQVRPTIPVKLNGIFIRGRSILNSILFFPEFLTASRSFHRQQKWPKMRDAKVDAYSQMMGSASLISMPNFFTNNNLQSSHPQG